MAVTSTCTITLQCPVQVGLSALNDTEIFTNASGVGIQQTVALTNTPGALTIPAGTRAIKIQGPSGNTNNLYIGNDNVLAHMLIFDPVNPLLWPCITSAPACYLAAAANTTVFVTFI